MCQSNVSLFDDNCSRMTITHMWARAEVQSAPWRINLMTLFPGPAPVETMARVVPLWAWLAPCPTWFIQGFLYGLFPNGAQRRFFSDSDCVCLCVFCVCLRSIRGRDNLVPPPDSLQHRCHPAWLFIYLTITDQNQAHWFYTEAIKNKLFWANLPK